MRIAASTSAATAARIGWVALLNVLLTKSERTLGGLPTRLRLVVLDRWVTVASVSVSVSVSVSTVAAVCRHLGHRCFGRRALRCVTCSCGFGLSKRLRCRFYASHCETNGDLAHVVRCEFGNNASAIDHEEAVGEA